MTRITGPSGVVIDVDPMIADGLVMAGNAVYVDASVVVPAAVQEVIPETAPVGDGKPRGNASLEEWAAYATAQGKDVAGLSRDEVRSLFKE